MAPSILALVLLSLQQPTTPAQTPATTVPPQPQVVGQPLTAAPLLPAARLSAPFVVADPTRIAQTPNVDGKFDADEWDPLGTTADGAKTFFEWEPGKLHGAAVVPTGRDAVFSFDIDSNGWLQGKDNLEIRLSMSSGKPTATVRFSDCTSTNGPTWVTIPGIEQAITVGASADSAGTAFEFSFTDPGLSILPGDPGDTIGIRVDDPLTTDAPFDAFIPRIMTPVTLVYHRAAGLPNGVQFHVENEGRYFVPGENGKIRLLFNGSNDSKLQQLELHTEGVAKNDTNMLTVPFPKFDSHGRTFVDFPTGIRDTAGVGFRVLRGTLTAGDGVSAVLETAFRVSPLADITLVPQPLKVADIDRTVRFGFYVHSNSGRAAGGAVTPSVPLPLKLVNTQPQKFDLVTGRARVRSEFEIYIPAKIVGTFPIHFTGEIDGKPFDQIAYITVGGV